jgi:hypothetical protein
MPQAGGNRTQRIVSMESFIGSLGGIGVRQFPTSAVLMPASQSRQDQPKHGEDRE